MKSLSSASSSASNDVNVVYTMRDRPHRWDELDKANKDIVEHVIEILANGIGLNGNDKIVINTNRHGDACSVTLSSGQVHKSFR